MVQESKLFCLFTDMLTETECREERKAASSVRLGAILVSQAGMKLKEILRIDSTQRKSSGSLKPSLAAPEEEMRD